MAAIVATVFVIVCVAGLFFLHMAMKKKFRKNVLPGQIKVVQELLKEIDQYRFRLALVKQLKNEMDQTLSLFEIANYMDEGSGLSDERYHEYKVLFTESACSLTDLSRYKNQHLLPRVIRNELRNFDLDFEQTELSEDSYFRVSGIGKKETDTSELFEAPGEAFESWQSLMESTHSLRFVIGQWMKENYTKTAVSFRGAVE